MFTMIRNAFMSLILFTILAGFVYPLVVTGIAQAIFPSRANGSIITRGGKPVGSALIGQQFEDPGYFWGRLSATTPYPYNGGSSSGSNLGPNNPELMKAVQARIHAVRTADPDNKAKIPVDLVTASGSGLDPHISPAAAEYQVQRVAKARGLDETTVRALVAKETQGRWLGILGEPVVNVLKLNIALEGLPKTKTMRVVP
ncbi:MAG: potassium-transporting ATPase subunit KdpC [Nitrospiraceae bacterium]|nr:potassium-transporting ATPase subunit KdpC [Nitrospiraceae bacterium]